MKDPYAHLENVDGFNEAKTLAFMLFTDGVTYESFCKMPIGKQVAVAQGNAGLDSEALIRAIQFLASYADARVVAIEAYVERRRQGKGESLDA